MSQCSLVRAGICAGFLAFAGHALAADIALSGAVVKMDSTPLSGVTVRLVQAGLSATTDAQGAWTLAGVTNIRGARAVSVTSAGNLRLENGRLQIHLDGRDIAGRGHAGSLVSAKTQAGVVARSQAGAPDTLEYSYNKTVFLRDTLSKFDTAGIVRVYDTTVNPKIIHGYLKDVRDGKQYRTVTIGTQVWMAENLNFRVDSSFCYENDTANCGTYGRLYSWAVSLGLNAVRCNENDCGSLVKGKVQGVCPANWHVPSIEEWKKLTDTTLVAATVGTKLKVKSNRWYQNSGTDDYGFRALPSGSRSSDGKFYDQGKYGEWWTAKENFGSTAWYRYIYGEETKMELSLYTKAFGFSLRCLQD